MDPADSLDTATLTAGTRGWAGVQNRQKPGLLDAAALAVLVNGRLDDTGSVQLRPGTEWLCRPAAAQPRGLFYYDVDTAEAILACVDGKVYEIPASSGPVQPIQIANAILATSGRCQGAQLVDKFAIADGLRLLGLWREAGLWQTMQVATFTGGQALPAVRGVVSHNFRLVIWGGTGATAETLYASGVLEPWKFSAAEGIRVGRGEGDPIVVALPGPGTTLYVGKGGSWWQVDLTGAATAWTASAITHQRGCWAPDTAVVVNQDVLFLARDGVANLAKLANDAPVAPVDLISAPIEATIKRINWTAARRTACATMWGPYYLLAVPLDGAQRNNTVLAYNTTTQQWSGEWTGWTPEAFCQSKFDGQLATIMADRAGAIVRLDEALTTDGGADSAAAIPLELETAAFPFEAPDLLKLPVALDCEWRGGAATADVTLRADGGSPQTIAEDYSTAPESGGINRRLIANLRELRGGREMQIRMVTTGGAFGLRELTIKALPLRARWEPPPAELLVPPVVADDTPGTPTTLRQTDGTTRSVLLQEIDTITLPHDSLDFVCFRGGLTVPAGSYVIAYRRGSFAQDPIVHFSDLFDSSRQGIAGPEIFNLPNGINEFDILMVQGEYHLFYDDKTATRHRSAMTIEDLAMAADDLQQAGRYPTAIFDGGVWHLWVWRYPDSYDTAHLTATHPSGPYVLSDVLPTDRADIHVRRMTDGTYVAAYKYFTHGGTNLIGIMTGPSASGPWTDHGYIFSSDNRPAWQSVEEADPAVLEYGTERYCAYAAFDGTTQRIALVKLDSQWKASGVPVVIASPIELWQTRWGVPRIFNPVWLTDRWYYSHNPNGPGGQAAGWGTVTPTLGPIEDGRTPTDVLRIDFASGRDLATGIAVALHGDANLTGGTLATTSAIGGAFGPLNRPTISDFLLHVEFTPAAINGQYQMIARAATYNPNMNPIIALWITPDGKLLASIHAANGVGNINYTSTGFLRIGEENMVELAKFGSEVTIAINGAAIAIGSHDTDLTGLQEWSLANAKGRDAAYNQQFAGSISAAWLN